MDARLNSCPALGHPFSPMAPVDVRWRAPSVRQLPGPRVLGEVPRQPRDAEHAAPESDGKAVAKWRAGLAAAWPVAAQEP